MNDETEYPDDEYDYDDDQLACGCCRCCGCTCDDLCPECGWFFCRCDDEEE